MDIELREIEVHVPGKAKPLFRLPQLKIESGKKILIEGASGKGKTTLLHLIAGLFHPAKGEVRIGDTRLNAMSDEQRCTFRRDHIAVIFQKLNLIDHLTPVENIMLGRAESTLDAKRALAAVGLEERAGDRSSVLSVGEQQRVAVARVLASSPQVILADEPTSSLDESNAAKVMELLFGAAENKTLIVVSHDHRIEKRFHSVLRFEDLIQA